MLKLCIRYFPVAIFLFLAFLLWRGLSLDPRILPSTHMNRPMPNFVMPDLLHPHQSLSNKSVPKQWAVITFWASWCGACADEQPALLVISHSSSVKWIGINYKDTPSDAINWLKKHGNPFYKIGFDEKGAIGIDWGVYGTPEHYLVDSQGIIRDRYLGPMTESFWEKHWKPIVNA